MNAAGLSRLLKLLFSGSILRSAGDLISDPGIQGAPKLAKSAAIARTARGRGTEPRLSSQKEKDYR